MTRLRDCQGHYRAGTALLALRRPAEAVAALEAGAAVEPLCVRAPDVAAARHALTRPRPRRSNVQMRDALAQARAALADEPAGARGACAAAARRGAQR